MTITSRPTTLPMPPSGRMAVYLPDHAGQGPTAVFHLEGCQSIFRFAVKLLSHQIDIARAGEAILVPMREHMTPARFDPMARSLLGEHRYEKLRDGFERSWHCQGCEKYIRVGWRYYPTDDAGSVCAACCKGYPEYEKHLVKRPEPPAPPVVTAALDKELV